MNSQEARKQSDNIVSGQPAGGERDPTAAVTFIDLLFAIVISLAVTEAVKRPWFNPTTWHVRYDYAFEIVVILLGFSTLLFSWWGYHNSINRRGYYRNGTAGKLLFVVDVLIVVGYWLMLVKFLNFCVVLSTLAAVYALYAVWDCLRSRQGAEHCPRQWRRRGVTVLWALCTLCILIAFIGYSAFLRDGSSLTRMDWALLSLAHVVNFAYRWHKEHPRPGWLLDFLALNWLLDFLSRKQKSIGG